MKIEVVMRNQENIAVMRVENGWLIRTEQAYGEFTPLKVAETPAALVEIVKEWAVNQQAQDVLAKAGVSQKPAPTD